MEHIFTDQNFESEVLKSDKPVFVDFWAPWCGPCRMTGPIVEEIAKDLEGKNIKIGKVNVDDNESIAFQLNILSIPTFMIFKDGKPVDQIVGGVQKEKMLEMINKYL